MKPGLYVVRTYSHTDRRQLWSVESRCFASTPALDAQWGAEYMAKQVQRSAQDWLDFRKAETKGKFEWAIVEVKT